MSGMSCWNITGTTRPIALRMLYRATCWVKLEDRRIHQKLVIMFKVKNCIHLWYFTSNNCFLNTVNQPSQDCTLVDPYSDSFYKRGHIQNCWHGDHTGNKLKIRLPDFKLISPTWTIIVFTNTKRKKTRVPKA